MDAVAAFLQAKGFSRQVYVRPPREANDPTGIWLLLAAAYGLSNGSRLWYRTNDEALLGIHCLTRSKFEPTFYFKKSADNSLVFVLAVQVDNYLYTRTDVDISLFKTFLQDHFKIGSLERDSFPLLGCELTQHMDKSVTITQQARSSCIDTNSLDPAQKKKGDGDRVATPSEVRVFRSIVGQALYIGRLTNPVLQYICSSMANKVPSLCVRHLKTLKTKVNAHLKIPSTVIFRHPQSNQDFTLHAVSDAAISTASESARRGFIIFRRSGDVTHPIMWSARKLKRVARSSITAELLSASDAVSALAYIQHLLDEVLYHHDADATFDSRALYDLGTTVHEPTEPLNKLCQSSTLSRPCSYQTIATPKKVGTMSWSPRHYNVGDPLTKNNIVTAALLLKVLREGRYPHHPDSLFRTAEQPLTQVIDDLSQTEACWKEPSSSD